MDSHPSNLLYEELKKDLEMEIVEADSFYQWLCERIEARSLDKNRESLDLLIDVKNNQEKYLDKIRTEYTEKYY